MRASEDHNRSWLDTILACPSCHGRAVALPEMWGCSECGAEFVQTSDAYVSLYPAEGSKADSGEWQHRQDEMEVWYRDLLSAPERAAGCLHSDDSFYGALLRGLGGAVLDLGGGIGVTRHFLAAATRHVVLEPSLEWLSKDWTALTKEFPCLMSAPCFVHGVGEQLPSAPGLSIRWLRSGA